MEDALLLLSVARDQKGNEQRQINNTIVASWESVRDYALAKLKHLALDEKEISWFGGLWPFMLPQENKAELMHLALVAQSLHEIGQMHQIVQMLEDDADTVAGKEIGKPPPQEDLDGMKLEIELLLRVIDDIIAGTIDFHRIEVATSVKLGLLQRAVARHATRHADNDAKGRGGVPVVTDALLPLQKPPATLPDDDADNTSVVGSTPDIDAEEPTVPNNGGATCTVS